DRAIAIKLTIDENRGIPGKEHRVARGTADVEDVVDANGGEFWGSGAGEFGRGARRSGGRFILGTRRGQTVLSCFGALVDHVRWGDGSGLGSGREFRKGSIADRGLFEVQFGVGGH